VSQQGIKSNSTQDFIASEPLLSWKFLWPPLMCFFLTLVLYTNTLAPTVTGEDSGEFIGAAYFLGVPHPPGYPTWCIMAHPFTWLPWGNVAWQVNFSSAFFGAMTVFFVVLLVTHLTMNRFAAIVAGLALAVSREFWQQSVIAEVYTLNTLYTGLCLFLLVRWNTTKNIRLLYAFALIYGLGWGVHNTIWVLGPLFALYILYGLPAPRIEQWKSLLIVMGWATTGLLVYLYLPVRAAESPPVNWGNPDTIDRFWAVVSREQFQFMFTQYPRSFTRFFHQLILLGNYWAHQFTLPITLIGIAGLLHLCLKRPTTGLLFSGVALMTLCSVAYAQNFNFDREWLWVMRVFGLPAYIVTAIGLGWIISKIENKIPLQARLLFYVISLVVCVLPGLLLHYRENTKSDYFWAEDYAQNILNSLPENAVYVPEADHAVFPVMYLQDVQGLRPDVLLGRRYGYVSWELAPGIDAETRATMGEFPRRSEEHVLFTWLLANTDRPVYFSRIPSLPYIRNIHFEPAGLLYRAVRDGEAHEFESKDYWGSYSWRNKQETIEPQKDYTVSLILSEIAIAKGRDALIAGETDTARQYIEHGLIVFGGLAPQLLNNIGIMCIRHGAREMAQDYFERAITAAEEAKDPISLKSAQQNLVRLNKGA